jgi:hypothetical protein
MTIARARRGKVLAGVYLVLAALAGCGGGDSSPSQPPGVEDHLKELGQTLKSLAETNQKPPAKPAELDSIEPMLPTSYVPIRNGDIVYFWGATYSTGGNSGTTVVAHEKNAPSSGGFVLMQDGTVKKLSAAEFQAAPKAKK